MRVDLLLADRRCYTYEAYAARHVSRCFERASIAHRVIYLSDGALQAYLFHVQSSPPNWTLSFVNLIPHHTPLCDVIGIPHFFWLAESFSYAIHLLNSAYCKVGVSNQSLCQRLGSNNVVFLPSGVEEQTEREKKVFEVVLFTDLLDLSFLEKTWGELFPSKAIALIKRAIQLGDPIEAMPYFYYVEQYLNAQKTLQSVRAFKEVQLDIFGEHAGNNWLVRLPRSINLHTPLPFTEHFEVLKTSKIALLDPTSIWYLPAIAAGCLPLSPDEEKVKYYLAHPAEREKCLEELKVNLSERGWNQQTKHLVDLMKR